MIRSMTGYARAETRGPFGRLSWELRSVNHRYLDVSLRMPDDLRSAENEARALIAAKVSRGKVEGGLRLVREDAVAAPVAVDAAQLRELHSAIDTLARSGIRIGEADPMRVLAWPGVVKADLADNAPVVAAAMKLLEQALADFTATREREGERTKAYLLERCTAIEGHVKAVRERMPLVKAQWLEKLKTRCRELGAEVDAARLEQEVVMSAQRLDVDEELSRLTGHLAEVRKVLAREDAVGRRLDFLMQELNREANTLSSKSQDGEITRHGVELKVVIEQMREQVQNVE